MPSLHRLTSWSETAWPCRLRKVKVKKLLMQEDEADMSACLGLKLGHTRVRQYEVILLQDEPLAANSCT